MSLERYMTLALGHPVHGYYMTRDPLGLQGDFTTGPEISQMLGELAGAWMADSWDRLGRPSHPLLAEAGPGRGTLMRDMLRGVKTLPTFAEAVTIHLIETSPVLQHLQAQAIPGALWHDHPDKLPGGPLFIIANEFFDALPLRQFERTADGWYERLVTLAETKPHPRFGWTLSDHPTPPAAMTAIAGEAVLQKAPVGSLIEANPAAQTIIAGLANRLAVSPGVVLIIDYGPAVSAPGDSFQAVRNHRFVNPLEAPGSADLTAHVDFARLASIAIGRGVQVMGPVPQGDFLKALGIDTRAARLCATATLSQRRAVIAARHRLTAPSEMGTLFKVMALASPGTPTLSGFPPASHPPALHPPALQS